MFFFLFFRSLAGLSGALLSLFLLTEVAQDKDEIPREDRAPKKRTQGRPARARLLMLLQNDDDDDPNHPRPSSSLPLLSVAERNKSPTAMLRQECCITLTAKAEPLPGRAGVTTSRGKKKTSVDQPKRCSRRRKRKVKISKTAARKNITAFCLFLFFCSEGRKRSNSRKKRISMPIQKPHARDCFRLNEDKKFQGEEDGRRRGKQLFLFREGEKTNRFFLLCAGGCSGALLRQGSRRTGACEP